MKKIRVGDKVLYDGKKAIVLYIAKKEDFIGDKYVLETYDDFDNLFYWFAAEYEITKI